MSPEEEKRLNSSMSPEDVKLAKEQMERDRLKAEEFARKKTAYDQDMREYNKAISSGGKKEKSGVGPAAKDIEALVNGFDGDESSRLKALTNKILGRQSEEDEILKEADEIEHRLSEIIGNTETSNDEKDKIIQRLTLGVARLSQLQQGGKDALAKASIIIARAQSVKDITGYDKYINPNDALYGQTSVSAMRRSTIAALKNPEQAKEKANRSEEKKSRERQEGYLRKIAMGIMYYSGGNMLKFSKEFLDEKLKDIVEGKTEKETEEEAKTKKERHRKTEWMIGMGAAAGLMNINHKENIFGKLMNDILGEDGVAGVNDLYGKIGKWGTDNLPPDMVKMFTDNQEMIRKGISNSVIPMMGMSALGATPDKILGVGGDILGKGLGAGADFLGGLFKDSGLGGAILKMFNPLGKGLGAGKDFLGGLFGDSGLGAAMGGAAGGLASGGLMKLLGKAVPGLGLFLGINDILGRSYKKDAIGNVRKSPKAMKFIADELGMDMYDVQDEDLTEYFKKNPDKEKELTKDNIDINDLFNWFNTVHPRAKKSPSEQPNPFKVPLPPEVGQPNTADFYDDPQEGLMGILTRQIMKPITDGLPDLKKIELMKMGVLGKTLPFFAAQADYIPRRTGRNASAARLDVDTWSKNQGQSGVVVNNFKGGDQNTMIAKGSGGSSSGGGIGSAVPRSNPFIDNAIWGAPKILPGS